MSMSKIVLELDLSDGPALEKAAEMLLAASRGLKVLTPVKDPEPDPKEEPTEKPAPKKRAPRKSRAKKKPEPEEADTDEPESDSSPLDEIKKLMIPAFVKKHRTALRAKVDEIGDGEKNFKISVMNDEQAAEMLAFMKTLK